MTSNIYLGRYQDTLAEHTWDALICDPPYSEKTHTGHNDGVSNADNLRDQLERMRRRKAAGLPMTSGAGRRGRPHTEQNIIADIALAERKGAHRRSIEYAAWTPEDVRGFVQWSHPRTRGWMVCFCDHVLAAAYVAAMQEQGRYVFAPIAWYAPGSRVRMIGDGPSCWLTWIVVSRPKSRDFSRWGSLPGGYSGAREAGVNKTYIGGKPLWMMREIVCDYSRPGDTVCDPCAGWGTTLVAARAERRNYVGSEMDPVAYAVAERRLNEPMPLFAAAQTSLLEPEE